MTYTEIAAGGAGFGFSRDQAAAMRAELERELADRRRYYPGQVAKARLEQRRADYQLAILAEIRADLDVAFHPEPWTVPSGMNLVAPQFPWAAKIKELERELSLRERYYPDRIAKLRLTEAEARERIAALQWVHDLYWREMFAFDEAPAEQPARGEAVRAHMLLVAAEGRQQQEELGV